MKEELVEKAFNLLNELRIVNSKIEQISLFDSKTSDISIGIMRNFQIRSDYILWGEDIINILPIILEKLKKRRNEIHEELKEMGVEYEE